MGIWRELCVLSRSACSRLNLASSDCDQRTAGSATFSWKSRRRVGHNARRVDGGDMASVLARLLAALRGSSIPSPGGRNSGSYPAQVRVRSRQGANAAPDAPVDRNTRMSGIRVKRLRQIAAFYADSANEA